MEIKHTPTPWRVDTLNHFKVVTADATIAYCPQSLPYFGIKEGEGLANAAFIVRACNAHVELVQSLKIALSALQGVYDHADYCGWGDSYERSGVHDPDGVATLASKALEQGVAAIAKAEAA